MAIMRNNKLIFGIILVFICNFFAATPSFGESLKQKSSLSSQTLLQWDETNIENLRKQGDISGLQLAVIKDSQLTIKKYGQNGNTTPWTNDDLLRIASVSKTMMATLFFKLEEQGQVSFVDTLDEYLDPSILPLVSFSQITMEDLLQHKSGIPDYFTEDFIEFIKSTPTLVKTEAYALAAVKNLPPAFKAGTQFQYSNTNTLILGLVLDKIAARMQLTHHAELMRALVLNPFHLGATFYEIKEAHRYQSKKIVNGYFNGLNTVNIQQGYGLAGGGMLSKTGDVAMFFHSLFNSEYTSTVIKKMMPPTGEKYGFGIYALDSDLKFYGHTGEWAGYLTFAAHNKETNTTLVGFANNSSDNAKKAFTEIRELLFSKY